MEIMEDNAACIIAIKKGYSPAMRYLKRTQNTSLGLLHGLTENPPPTGDGKIKVVKADTAIHRGDMFTKALGVHDFQIAIARIGMHKAKL